MTGSNGAKSIARIRFPVYRMWEGIYQTPDAANLSQVTKLDASTYALYEDENG